jgi:hypothetical protein
LLLELARGDQDHPHLLGRLSGRARDAYESGRLANATDEHLRGEGREQEHGVERALAVVHLRAEPRHLVAGRGLEREQQLAHDGSQLGDGVDGLRDRNRDLAHGGSLLNRERRSNDHKPLLILDVRLHERPLAGRVVGVESIRKDHRAARDCAIVKRAELGLRRGVRDVVIDVARELRRREVCRALKAGLEIHASGVAQSPWPSGAADACGAVTGGFADRW